MKRRGAPGNLLGMLVELSAQNLALLEHASLGFGHGLNVLTGETGAGKSLVLGALEFLLGEKPRGGMVRTGEDEARVEGRFEITVGAELVREWMHEHVPDALEEDEAGDLELLLSRRLTKAGRTRAHVNHRPVTQRALRELASRLVEIHGQNEHQRLLEPAEQKRLVDAFGEHAALLERYRNARGSWLELRERVRAWQEERAERLDRLDLLRYQVGELADARLSPDEHGELCAERDRLRHAGELSAHLGAIVHELYDADDAALDRVRRSERTTSDWEDRIAELAAPAEALRETVGWLEQAESGLRSFVDGIEVSPARLEEVEERLAELDRLQRKYRVEIPELCVRAAELESELERLESEQSGLEDLRDELAKARKKLVDAAGKLTSARKRVRSRLARAVQGSLADLGLQHTTFEVVVEPRVVEGVDSPNADPDKFLGEVDTRLFGPSGTDEVEFKISANPGEEPQPLRAVASGGETARIMLALRSALALKQTIPTLVFDEVDAGVGGRLAPRVGAHLKKLGEHHQILCVTHLPAVAAVAHTHLKVQKQVTKGRTRTRITELEGDARVEEVADMIAGGADQETARAEARRLLRSS